MSASDPQPPAVSGLPDLIESWRRSRDVERKTAAQQLVFNTRESELLETSADTYDSCADELEPLAAAVDDAVARLTRQKAVDDLAFSSMNHLCVEAETERDALRLENARLREERDTAAERAIQDAVDHWFLQGGKAQFGELEQPELNGDGLISAILTTVRAHVEAGVASLRATLAATEEKKP